MKRALPQASSTVPNADGERDYLFDMIAELAKLARRSGEFAVAIHLEAILAVRRAQDARRPA